MLRKFKQERETAAPPVVERVNPREIQWRLLLESVQQSAEYQKFAHLLFAEELWTDEAREASARIILELDVEPKIMPRPLATAIIESMWRAFPHLNDAVLVPSSVDAAAAYCEAAARFRNSLVQQVLLGTLSIWHLGFRTNETGQAEIRLDTAEHLDSVSGYAAWCLAKRRSPAPAFGKSLEEWQAELDQRIAQSSQL